MCMLTRGATPLVHKKSDDHVHKKSYLSALAGATPLCSTRTAFAYSPSTGTSDGSWASCTRSVVCCSSHPSILTYCEVESMAKAAVPCYRSTRAPRLPSDGMSSCAHISSAERTTGLTVSDRRGPTIAAKHHVSRVIEDIDVIGKPKDNVVRRTRRVCRYVRVFRVTVWCTRTVTR